jgi:lysophospholipase L1-like esterase
MAVTVQRIEHVEMTSSRGWSFSRRWRRCRPSEGCHIRRAISITVVALVWLLAPPATATAAPLPRCTDQGWVGAWAAPPSDASRGTDTVDSFDLEQYDQSLNPKLVVRNVTTRAILTPTFGGSTTRVWLSNRFGAVPVTFAQATIARRATEAALVPGTTAPLTFGGAQSVTVAPGRDVVSDPAEFSFNAFQPLAVSVYVTGDVGKPTEHYTARQTSYLTPEDAGDHTEDVDGGAFTQRTTTRPFVTGIDVVAPLSNGAVVALGDSITDGFQQPASVPTESPESIDADGRWPDVLARRLRAANRPLSVLNAGLAGNRVLLDSAAGGNPDVFGPAAIRRLDADVLSQASVTTVIVLEGINDLTISPYATVEEVLGGYRQLIDRMHARGLRVLLGTITPLGGFEDIPPDTEAKRQAVDTWIREQSPADGVIDFDAAVRDPADPSRIAPAYDGGDHLHFNLAGYLVMGNAVPLELLLDPACS